MNGRIQITVKVDAVDLANSGLTEILRYMELRKDGTVVNGEGMLRKTIGAWTEVSDNASA